MRLGVIGRDPPGGGEASKQETLKESSKSPVDEVIRPISRTDVLDRKRLVLLVEEVADTGNVMMAHGLPEIPCSVPSCLGG